MPKENQEQPTIERATLIELTYKGGAGSSNGGSATKSKGREVPVQFNPQTLSLSYSNRTSGADQQKSSGTQHIGKGTTRLSVDLLFDATRTTGSTSDNASGTSSAARSGPKDVREKTRQINKFMEQTKEAEGTDKHVPPSVRFSWGTFLFDGVIDSMSETLEFFDEKGRPLRASVSLTMTRQRLRRPDDEKRRAGGGAGRAGGPDPEERPPGAENTSGTPLQKLAGERGKQGNWKDIAQANDIENPRSIVNPGAVDMSASASAGISAEG